MMRCVLSPLFITSGLLIATSLAAVEPGAKVVVVRPAQLQAVGGAAVPLTPGTAATVRVVDGPRLQVAAGRLGWVDAAAVISADEADAHFSAILARQPDDAAALLARGKIRLDKGSIDEALTDLDRGLQLAPSSEAHTFRGWAWKRKGDKERALAEFNEAIRLDPQNVLARRVRGATWAGKEDYAQALADYTESIRVDPTNPDCLHHRALLLSACNDPQIRNGRQAIEDATKACEVSGWASPLYMIGLASAYAETGDFDSAVKWQLKVIELSGSSGPASQLNQRQLEQYRDHKPFRMSWK